MKGCCNATQLKRVRFRFHGNQTRTCDRARYLETVMKQHQRTAGKHCCLRQSLRGIKDQTDKWCPRASRSSQVDHYRKPLRDYCIARRRQNSWRMANVCVVKSARRPSKFAKYIRLLISFKEEPRIIPREGYKVSDQKKARVPFTAVLAHLTVHLTGLFLVSRTGL